MRLHNRLTINYEMTNLTATAIGPTADAVCIIWTVRQCWLSGTLALLALDTPLAPSPSVRLGLGPVRLSVGAAEINDKVDLRAVGNCVQVNRNRRAGGGTFRWAGTFAYRNDLLANDKCG